MSVTSRCPECGTELTTGATDGLCPRCLLQAAMDSHDAVPPFDSPYAATTPQSGAFTPPEPAELMPHFPQLEILELLGHGGMGAVYKARQKKLDRLVALKIIRPESADDPAFAERFNREARTLARLSHPNIVAVHDFGEVGPASRAGFLGPAADRSSGGDSPARQAGPTLYFFVMEYVDGPNLRQMLEAAELQPAAALAIVPQVCEALQYAHDAGVVHRDIKPENILLDRKGRVKIADFGLAKLSQASPEDFTLTATHQVMGTPRYMAPEQMAGSRAVDHRADIYSLGVVFYEMLTGELPMGHFAPPSQKSPAVDARLDEVVLRALASEPERRYQQASELETDIEAISSSAHGPESGATVLSGMSHDSRPGMSSILEQNVAAAAGWFGGRPKSQPDSGRGAVAPRDVTRPFHRSGIALILYGLLLLPVAALLITNGIDIADGNDGTPREVGIGFIVAGLSIVGIGGWLLLERRERMAVFAPSEQSAGPAELPRDLRGPSIGLIITGLVNWVGIPVAVLVVTGWANVPLPPQPVVVLLAILALVAAGAIIAAGILMRRLRAWPFAIVGSVLAMVVSPGSLIGLPIGIWALVVLSQPEVREAFRRRREGDSSEQSGVGSMAAAPGGRDWAALSREDIEHDRLPDVCMVCGVRTTERVNRTFEHTSDWAAVLIFVGILAGIIPGIIIALATSRNVRVACPVCPRHRSHWRRLIWVASTGWLLVLVLGGIGLLIGNASAGGGRERWVWGTAIGTATGLVLWLIPLIYLAATRVSVEAITADEVRFQRVAPAFARAARGVTDNSKSAIESGAAPSRHAPWRPPTWLVLSTILVLVMAGLGVVLLAAWDVSSPQPAATSRTGDARQAGTRPADEERPPSDARPALHRAVAAGDVARVKQLLDAGENVNQKASDGRTPLMAAVANGHDSLAIALLILGADLAEQDQRGRTAMMLAVEQGDTAFLRQVRELYSISYHSVPEWRQEKFRALSGAAQPLLDGREIDLQFLPILDAELRVDESGETASIKAARLGDWNCLNMVATHTDSILARDNAGRTVLMHAAINGHADWFRKLTNNHLGEIAFTGTELVFDLERSLSVLDQDGKSAFEHAAEHGHQEIVRILRDHLQAIVESQTAIINAGGEQREDPDSIARANIRDEQPADRLAKAYRLRRLAWQALGEHERAEADFLQAND